MWGWFGRGLEYPEGGNADSPDLDAVLLPDDLDELRDEVRDVAEVLSNGLEMYQTNKRMCKITIYKTSHTYIYIYINI